MNKVFFGIFFFAVMAAAAQKAPGSLTLTKGQTLQVVTNMNLAAETMMGPASGNMTMADTYTVNDAAANTFTLVKVPKQIKMNFSVMSQEIKIDTDNPKEMNSMFAETVKDIMSQKPEFTIDEAGKILSVKKSDKKKEEAPAAGMMSMMMPGLEQLSAAPQAGNPSFLAIIPANRTLRVGDTWADSLNDGENKNITRYKVKDITANEILLDFEGEGTTVTAKEAMGMNVSVNASSKATGSLALDKATGLLKQRTSTNTVETSMNLGGREVTSTMKSTVVTNIKPS